MRLITKKYNGQFIATTFAFKLPEREGLLNILELFYYTIVNQKNKNKLRTIRACDLLYLAFTHKSNSPSKVVIENINLWQLFHTKTILTFNIMSTADFRI